MKRLRLALNVVLAIAFIALVADHFSPSNESKLNGTWIKTSGIADLPDEITLQRQHDQFRMRYYHFGDIRTVDLLCDGKEHLYWKTPDETSYKAVLTGDSLVVTLQTKVSPSSQVDQTDEWTPSSDGKTLTVTSGNDRATYSRRPLLSSLFSGAP